MDPSNLNRNIYAGMIYKLDIGQEGRNQMRAAIELGPDLQVKVDKFLESDGND